MNYVKLQISRREIVLTSLSALLTGSTSAALRESIIRVGPRHSTKTLEQAAAQAHDGDTFEVDAGEYRGDVAIWNKKNITLTAVGGRVKLLADGLSAEGKGIFVLRGGQMRIEGFDFSGAQVPDQNGAGIRLENGTLTVVDCTFSNNQNGMLVNNNAKIELNIVNCEFHHNGYGDGQSHNLYVGSIGRLSVSGSYFHHAKVGHLIKSRAAINHIFYNRLTDEPGASASYELEFASGGIAFVVGNIIAQSAQTENPHMISFGAEGYEWPDNALYLVNNTLVDNRSQGGVFLRVKPKNVTVKALNNLLVGRSKLEAAGPGDYRNNFTVDWNEFALAAREDYRLVRSSKLLGKALDAGMAHGQSLMPTHDYVHPRHTIALQGPARHPGALQTLA
jgi:hypothetical protein